MLSTSLCFTALVRGALRAPMDKPNIVMFFVDDLGYGDLGFNGHPTTHTPNIDKLAHGGKILTSWYSGCPVCSGSRAALMTGRQYNRVGTPGVFGPGVATGLPTNETTVAAQLKKVGYKTAAMGKWHLGQRSMFLPAAHGFDEYLGIPYSDDMGDARHTPCGGGAVDAQGVAAHAAPTIALADLRAEYAASGFYDAEAQGDLSPMGKDADPGTTLLPLVHQANGATTVLEQPLDFTTLATKYNAYVDSFISSSANESFFLYMPFSHVHTTSSVQPEKQYAGCAFQNTSVRGKFGDALAEVDWLVGKTVAALEAASLEKNTLILFTSDNGPWMSQHASGGSTGIHSGRWAGYWNTGKGSTWEGGNHEAAFAYFPGQIEASSRSHEVTSSLDLFATASALAGVPLPTDRVYDGKDMGDILFSGGASKHEFLFFYGGCKGSGGSGPSAVRYGAYKVCSFIYRYIYANHAHNLTRSP
jgi:arylsulfatase A